MADIKIGVDADDATRNIEALQTVFAKFATASEKQTETWAGVGAEVAALTASVTGLAGVVSTVAEAVAGAGHEQERLSRATEQTSRHWQRLSRFTRDVASHVKDAASTMLKWTGIGAVVAGAAGFGAEHYLFDVAGQVGARRSTALGYGTTYGGLQSARANYARFGDADSALGNIAAAQSGDFDKRLGLQNLGVDASPGRDATEVLADVMKRAKDKVDAMPAGIGLAQYARNLHLDDVLPLDTLQRLQHGGVGTRGEVYGQADKMLADRKGLDLAPDVQRKWQELATQLSRAGTTIETALVNRLVALEPGLQKLSDALATAGTILLKKDGPVAQWLDELGKGLDGVAKWLDDPDTQKRLEAFAGDVGRAAEYVWDLGKKAVGLLHWLAQLVGDDAVAPATALSGDTVTPGREAGGGTTPSSAGGGSTPRTGGGGRHHESYITHSGSDQGTTPSVAGSGGVGRNSVDIMRGLEDQLRAEGVAPEHVHAAASALMGNVVQESGGDPTRTHDRGTGYGLYGARLDRRDRMFSWLSEHKYARDSAEGQARYMAHEAMSERYAKTAAALRGATRANLDDVTNMVTTNFENPAPATANYGGRRNNAAAAYARGTAPARVTVSTNPGGNPHTATAAAAAPQ